MKDHFTISEVCSKLNTETHNLRYLEKVMELDIHRDSFENRIYTKDDIDTLKDIIMLRNQGLNYKAIKIVLKASKKDTSSYSEEYEESAMTLNHDENIEDPKTLQLYDYENMEIFKDILQETMREVIAPIDNEVKELKNTTYELLEQNKSLKIHLEKEQEKHFKNLDEKLTKWREENSKNKSFLSRLFNKK